MSKRLRQSSGTTPSRRPRHRARRPLRRLAWLPIVVAALAVVYLVMVVVGLIPVNNDFRPAANGVEIAVVSTAVHADVVMPLVTDAFDWRGEFPSGSFGRRARGATHVAVGWGDRGVYLETPTWADLEISTAATALFLPSRACMHVSMTRGADSGEGARQVTLSPEQYAALVRFVRGGFRRDADGRVLPIAGASYGANDAFFEARGSYNFVNTCNTWAGRALREAGVRTPWWTPLPRTVFLYFPE